MSKYTSEKVLRKRRRILAFIAVIYILMLVYFLFFSEHYGRNVRTEGYRYNLTPFEEIGRFIKYRDMIGPEYFLVNIVGNVLAFVPLGFFMPVLIDFCERFYITVFFTAFFSLMVEAAQLVTRVGSFDVDDLILNTAGGFLGWVIFRIFRKKIKKPVVKKREKRVYK